MFGEIDRYVSDALEEKKFYTKDKESWAAATIGCTRDAKTGEIVNGSIYIHTSGGMYYKAHNYRYALEKAEWLVKEWDKKNWEAEDDLE